MRSQIFLIAGCLYGAFGFGQMMKPMEIDEEGRVTIRVEAPEAERVQAQGKGGDSALGPDPIDLERDAAGTWVVTTNPTRPGFHYYDILIDGTPTTDPQSPSYFGWGRWTSGLEVPDPENDFYLPKTGVPRGQVRIVYYDSETTGRTRRCLVYTPAGYDEANSETVFPTLYLQHGAGESEIAWLDQGKVNFIMDNLIHEGMAVPMLVVMDNGYAASPRALNWYRPSFSGNVFPELLVEELVPFIETKFRVRGAAEGRAIAGLSMGGQQASSIVIGNPDTFAYLGMFSAGLSSPASLRQPVVERLNEKMKLVWVGTGLQDEFFESYILVSRNAFVSRGVDHQYETVQGAHEWQVWRKCLRRFASKLFKTSLAAESIKASVAIPDSGSPVGELVLQLPQRCDFELEVSRDLVSWERREGWAKGDDDELRLILTGQSPSFVRMVELPWE